MSTGSIPPFAASATALGSAQKLIAQNKPAEAAAMLRKHLYANPRDRAARKRLATLGEFAHPNPALPPKEASIRKRVLQAGLKEDWQTVLASAEPLLKRQPLLGDVAVTLGKALVAVGRIADAIRVLNHALRVDPARPDAYLILSTLFHGQSNPTETLAAAKAAEDVAPDLPATQVALGMAHLDNDQVEAAIDHFRNATNIAPSDPIAWDAWCRALERLNRLDDLDEVLKNAEIACPNEPMIQLNRGIYLVRRKEYDGAIAALNSTDASSLSPGFQVVHAANLGRAFDETGVTDKAFAAFSKMNTVVTPLQGGASGADRFLKLVEDRLKGAEQIDPSAWDMNVSRNQDTPVVFMVGFPRSGTTLLETILLAHPKVSLAEEAPMMEKMQEGIRSDAEAQDLAALSDEEIAARAKTYFDGFQKHAGPIKPDQIAFDKMPLNLVNAAIIRRVFPDVRFVFSIRHPCDVVLSCFMQNFASNDAMDNFRDLTRAAKLYDRAMKLWQAYRDQLDLDVVEIRYEDMVQELQATATPVLDFVGLEWTDAMTDFHEFAARKPVIRTASYRQVSQKLYTSAAGRWRRYDRFFEDAMPYLTPWIERFGYDT